MKKNALYILLMILVSSCATYMNESYTKIRIRTSEPSDIYVGNQKYSTGKRDFVKIPVERKNDTLSILIKADTINKRIKIKPINSVGYYYFLFCTFGTSYFFDKNSPERFGYQKDIFVDLKSSDNNYCRFPPFKKGQLYWRISAPYINMFRFTPSNNVKINTGFMGISTGFDYFYKSDNFISLNIGAVTDFFAPIGPADIRGSWESMNSMFFNISNNYSVKSFDFGYGIHISKNSWNFYYRDSISRLDEKISNKGLGLLLKGYYRLSKNWNVGILYQPTIIGVGETVKFKYEHLVSIDFAYRIKIK